VADESGVGRVTVGHWTRKRSETENFVLLEYQTKTRKKETIKERKKE
jgi:hypothetical protein